MFNWCSRFVQAGLNQTICVQSSPHRCSICVHFVFKLGSIREPEPCRMGQPPPCEPKTALYCPTQPCVVQTQPCMGQTQPCMVQTQPCIIQTPPCIIQTQPCTAGGRPRMAGGRPARRGVAPYGQPSPYGTTPWGVGLGCGVSPYGGGRRVRRDHDMFVKPVAYVVCLFM